MSETIKNLVAPEANHPEFNASSALHDLAEKILDDPQANNAYQQTMWQLIGDPDPTERFAGRHPLVKKWIGSFERVYFPVFAGVDNEQGRALFVGKDGWHHPEDPEDWFVVWRSLKTGITEVPTIIRSGMTPYGDVRLQFADVGNWPRGKHPAYFQEPRNRNRIEMQVDENCHTLTANVRYGQERRPEEHYEDISVLHSMITLLEQARVAQRYNASDRLWLPVS